MRCADGDLAGPWRVVGESAAGHPFAGTLGARRGGAHLDRRADAGRRRRGAAAGERHARRRDPDAATAKASRRRATSAAPGSTFARTTRCCPPGRACWPGANRAGAGRRPCRDRGSPPALGRGDRQRRRAGGRPGARAPITRFRPATARCWSRWRRPMRRAFDGSARCRTGSTRCSPRSAMRPKRDVIVTSGGASVGDHDLVRPALEAWGARDRLLARGDAAGQAAAGRRGVASSGSSACPATRYRATSPRSCSCSRCCASSAERASGCPPRHTLTLAAPLPRRRKPTRVHPGARCDGDSVAPLAEQDSSALALARRRQRADPARRSAPLPPRAATRSRPTCSKMAGSLDL